ncbi:aldo/keto reductase [Ancylomarina sp. DW003]|nr:aldo/keto reductase [Ancylomarina sp. DW003]MDE5421638.1 aldo/keto reductase [Ancylomarina sp. DW003]
MIKTQVSEGLQLSRIIHGHWRLADWKLPKQELLKLTEQCIELGVTSFDHADIYGNYSCESLFGDALSLKPPIRQNIEIISKCGIKLMSDKFPERKLKTYDYSYNHIVSSVDASLKNIKTDYLDILLLHRPSPFFDPEEVAKAFSDLKRSGKVLNFGVSNFTSQQFEMLNTYTEEPLVTNQVEISPYCLDHFDNGNIDFFLKEKIKPMAWSPLAGGQLLSPQTEKGRKIVKVLFEIAEELNLRQIDQIIYAWLLKHPVGIIPVVGTSKIERIKSAVEAINIDMSHEQWFRIYESTGADMP